jgi:hypothetical protein
MVGVVAVVLSAELSSLGAADGECTSHVAADPIILFCMFRLHRPLQSRLWPRVESRLTSGTQVLYVAGCA